MVLILPPDFSELYVVASILRVKELDRSALKVISNEFFEIIKCRYFIDTHKIRRFKLICNVLRSEHLKLIFSPLKHKYVN